MDSGPVKIFSKHDVPRLRYIAAIILGDILGLSWEIITDKRKLGKQVVINYSHEVINGSFKISPDPLLFEAGIVSRDVIVNEWRGIPVFFMTTPDSDFPFDVFAASFFLVSRYEEYLDFQPDEYGRFPASLSLAFKNDFLRIPIVDIWAKEVAKALVKRFQTIAFRRNEYRSLLSIDINQPYAYLGKGLLRSIGSLFHDLKNNSVDVGDRYRILAKEEKDPYDVFDYIIKKTGTNNTDACFFFTVGDHSKYDKNPSWKYEEYRKLILMIDNKYRTGLQPSFYSAENSLILNTEMVRLKTILNKEVIMSRFHYIRFFLPQSYRDISKAGILEDYSMGYPEEPGFRAGIARPYYFYDIAEDQQTSLKLFPFEIMDETLFNYKNLDQLASKEIILKMINEVRKAGGLFVSIWHNTSLLDNKDWLDRREVFEFMLKNQVQ
jgi:hypothetical protein